MKTLNTKNNQKGFANMVLVGVLVLAIVAGYFILNKKTPTNTKQTQNLTFSDNAHISFQYPSDWKVVRSENHLGQFILQPSDDSAPETKDMRVNISVSGHCMNSQCLTVYSLDDMVKEFGATVISTVSAKNVTGYKVSVPTEPGKTQTNYMFIKGDDFVEVGSNMSEAEFNKINIIPTLELLAPDTKVDTSNWKTYTNTQYGFEFQYPSDRIYKEIKGIGGDGVSYFNVNVDTKENIEFKCEACDGPATFFKVSVYKPKDNPVNNCYPASQGGEISKVVVGGISGDKCIGDGLNSPNLSIYLSRDGVVYNNINADNYSGEQKVIVDRIISTFKFTK